MLGLEFGWEIGVAFAVVLVLMALPHVSRKIHGHVDYIQTHELHRMLKAGESVAVLDLRPQKEYSNYHIAEAIHLPLDKIENYFAGMSQQDTGSAPTVLVCQSDLDSTRMAGRLRRRGMANIRVMQGGMYRWKRDSFPIKRT